MFKIIYEIKEHIGAYRRKKARQEQWKKYFKNGGNWE